MPAKKQEKPVNQVPPVQVNQWVDLWHKLADKFGVPTAFLVGACIWISVYSSTQQKSDMIDMYVLGRGLTWTPFGVILVVGVVMFAGQNHYYRVQLKAKDREIERVGIEKSELQQKLIKGQLHHTEGASD